MRIASLLLVALLLSACSAGKETAGADALLQKMKQDLRAGRLKKVKIVYLDYAMATYVPVTPETLEGYASLSGRVNIYDDIDATIKTSLLAALDKTTLSPAENPPDVRWGATFYDARGSALHSIYIGKEYSNDGYIDGKRAGLNGALREWFERTFEDLMKAVRERK